MQERASTYYHLLVSYGIVKDVEEDNGQVFQPGEAVEEREGTGVGKKGSSAENAKLAASKEKKSGAENGRGD